MLKFIISLVLALVVLPLAAQDKPIDLRPKDTVVRSQKYGLRVGIDLSRPIHSLYLNGYRGLELTGDYRLKERMYLAGELGNEKYPRHEDLYHFTTKGSYIKVGMDFNTYQNWYGEQNMIFVGGRIAFSTFGHTVTDAHIYDSNRYWSPDGFAQTAQPSVEYNSLTATWLEGVMGIKVELATNLFLGASVRLGLLITNKEPDNFGNLFIPGFNKVTEGARFGVGYNYGLSYLIPFYKKAKEKTVKEATPVQE